MDRWLGRLDRDAASALGWLAVKPQWAAALLVAFCLAVNLPGIASLPVTDRDEARFAQATKQMLETGDYVDIRFQDEPRYKKPVGVYWLQALSVAAFSSPEAKAIWAYRIPSFLGILAAVLLLWRMAVPLYGRQNALLAALLLAAAMGVNLEARIAKADALLLACIVAAQLALGRIYLSQRTPRETMVPAALFWIAIGLGTLVKGPIAPGLAFLTILPLAIYDPERSWLRNLHFWWGIPLCLLIVLPWFVAIGIASGGEFFQQSLGKDFVAKLGSGQESHWGPPGFYLITFWWTFWPGALIATGGGALWLWRNRMHRRALFLLAWMVPFWLVIEAAPTKLPHYILPIFPAIAIAAAWVLREVAIPGTIPRRSYKQAAAIWLLVAVLQATFLIVVLVKFKVTPSPWLILLTIPYGVAAWLTFRAAWLERFYAALATGIVSAALVYIAAFRIVLPGTEAIWPSEQIAEIEQALRPCSSTPLMLTRFREPSAVFRVGTDTRMADELGALEALRTGKTDFAVFNSDAFNRIAKQGVTGELPQVLACISGFNVARGRKARLHVLTMKSAEALATCRLPAKFVCGPRGAGSQ
jgi:4-amino-4-deoxy-L-arabinose transferase-like glycosyltransferase